MVWLTDEHDRIMPRRLRVLRAIVEYRTAHGYSPTLREVAQIVGRHKTTVFEHVIELRRSGYLAPHTPAQQRTMIPTEKGVAAVNRTQAGRTPYGAHGAADPAENGGGA